jgi:hypothetical protein
MKSRMSGFRAVYFSINRSMFELYREALGKLIETSSIEPCDTPGAFGACHLAASAEASFDVDELYIPFDEAGLKRSHPRQPNRSIRGRLRSVRCPQRNGRPFRRRGRSGWKALASNANEIARAIDLIASAFKNDGRLFMSVPAPAAVWERWTRARYRRPSANRRIAFRR